MTEKEKQLLLKELCTRLCYNIKGLYRGIVDQLRCIDAFGAYQVSEYNTWFDLYEIPFKPYLRPMSSMTEEEKVEWEGLKKEVKERFWIDRLIDFYLSHHLDYRGLIPMGLALEAKEGMYD